MNAPRPMPPQPWSSRRPRVMVLAFGDRPGVEQEAERLRPAIAQHAEIVVWDLAFAKDLSGVDADFVIVLGGDGSILRAAHQMGSDQRPVVGVNLGKLGFLAALTPDELLAVLPDICSGQCRVVEHLMFDCRLLRGKQTVFQQLGLNEVAVRAGPPFSILQAHLYVDAELVTTYSCDGLIISTPVGSTAHCLSAGGPILRKNVQAFVILPISPHTLTNRPVVDSAERTFEIQVPTSADPPTVVVDGWPLGELLPHDRLQVCRAEPRFKMIEVLGHSYYHTLREKLGWGGSLSRHDKA